MRRSHSFPVRTLLLALIALFGSALPLPSHAADGFLKGTVEWFRLHDGTWAPYWAAPRFWFSLTGVTNAGACPTWNGRVLLVAETKEAYLAVVSANMAGKELAVYFNDAFQLAGFCRALQITGGNQPPSF